jgi:hypothetical protein
VAEVRTDAPQIGTRLGARQMEETPLLSRRISNLPMLNAANRPAISQGDGGGTQHHYHVAPGESPDAVTRHTAAFLRMMRDGRRFA